jgi:hypothetical protein
MALAGFKLLDNIAINMQFLEPFQAKNVDYCVNRLKIHKRPHTFFFGKVVSVLGKIFITFHNEGVSNEAIRKDYERLAFVYPMVRLGSGYARLG